MILLWRYGGQPFFGCFDIKKNIIHCKTTGTHYLHLKDYRRKTFQLITAYPIPKINKKPQPLQWGWFTTHPKPIHNPSTSLSSLLVNGLTACQSNSGKRLGGSSGNRRSLEVRNEDDTEDGMGKKRHDGFFFRCGKWCWGLLGWVGGFLLGGWGCMFFSEKKKTRRCAWKVCFFSSLLSVWSIEVGANSYCIFVGG